MEILTEAPVPSPASPPKWRKFLRARFTREGAVGLYLTVGFFACAGVAVLFGLLAREVFQVRGASALDRNVTLAIELLHTPARDRVARAVTRLGDQRVLIPATLIVVALLILRGRRVTGLLLGGVVVGGWLLETLLKVSFHRPRQQLWPALATETTWSFPSGHATMATLFYGALAATVLHLTRHAAPRRAALAGAALIILAVAYSRVYLGAHWVTDVLAGILVGSFWVVICATGTEYLARRKPRSKNA